MIVTPKEARQLDCCVVTQLDTHCKRVKCSGSSCMGWVWETERVDPVSQPKRTGKGYCSRNEK